MKVMDVIINIIYVALHLMLNAFNLWSVISLFSFHNLNQNPGAGSAA